MKYRVELQRTISSSVLVEAETDIDAFDEARPLVGRNPEKYEPEPKYELPEPVQGHVQLLSDDEWGKAKAEEQILEDALEEMFPEFETAMA